MKVSFSALGIVFCTRLGRLHLLLGVHYNIPFFPYSDLEKFGKFLKIETPISLEAQSVHPQLYISGSYKYIRFSLLILNKGLLHTAAFACSLCQLKAFNLIFLAQKTFLSSI